MLAQRLAQQSLRRALQRPAVFSRSIIQQNGAPAVASSLVKQQKRLASTVNEEKISIDQGYDILVQQRLKRPVSPHLGIYRPQITWYASAFNRITGATLSGAFYIWGFGYLIQPYIGYHIFESSSIIAAFAGMALWAKIPIKFTAAFFFMFHNFNGLRHLSWDLGRGIQNPAVIKSGWLVVGISAALSAWLAIM